jgi:hypothetical protein
MRMILVVAAAMCALACGGTRPPEEAWAAADYTRAGVPSLDETWGAAELVRAVDVIAREAAVDRDRLPRHGGAKSGTVFARLIAPAADEPMSLTARLEAGMKRYDALNRLSKIYLPDTLAAPSREVIEIWNALLREGGDMRAHMEPFLATFPADDPTLPTRREGIAKLELGMGGMIMGGVLMAADPRVSETDRAAMLRGITAAVPALWSAMPPDRQQATRERVTALVDATTGELHDEALRLAAALRK